MGAFVKPILVTAGVLAIPYLFSTLIIWIIPIIGQWRKRVSQSPQTLPYTVPLLRSTLPFLFDGLGLFLHASHSNRDRGLIHIGLLKDDVYLVHGAKHIAEVFRTSTLSVTTAYGIALRYCFGMTRKAASTYFADTSGSQYKPIKGDTTQAQNRVYFQTHESLLRGLLGSGLAPATARFEKTLAKSLESSPISEEWENLPDLLEFFEEQVGTAVINAIFGPKLLSLNPGFVRDLWAYDKVVMSLAKRLPAFCIPRAYKLRGHLLDSIKRWHTFARSSCEDAPKSHDGDADPNWGSKMMRDRYMMLLNVENQDYDSVASTDLGFIWASVTNVVPSAMTLTLHACRDAALRSDIRRSMTDTVELGGCRVDLKALENQPRLLSMYAETLRFSVQIHVPRTAPHQNLSVNMLRVPKNKLILINTWLAHTDEAVWNTKDGAFPLDKFWPERFLVDSKDPTSGPTKSNMRKMANGDAQNHCNENAHFSTEGLEGAWIPYGGGHHACPGRVLAKRIMLLSCAMMINAFDMEALADGEIEYGSPRFGFGVRKPNGKLPIRIRRRRHISISK